MKKWIGKFSYSTKLFFAVGIIFLLSIVAISKFDFYYSGKALEENTNSYLNSLAGVTLSKIDDTVLDVENVAFFINGNSKMQEDLKQYTDKKSGRLDKYQSYDRIRKMIRSYVLFNSAIESIDIISDGNNNINYSKIVRIEPLRADRFERAEEKYWLVDKESVIFVKDIGTYLMNEKLAKAAVSVDRKMIRELMTDIELAENGKAFLIDPDGIVVASDDEKTEGEKLSVYESYRTENESFYRNEKISGVNYSIYCSDPISNGWQLLLVLPRSEYIKDVYELRTVTIFIMAAILCLGVILMRIATNKTTRSIRRLSEAMEEFGQGNFEVNCRIDSEDEIGSLSQSFNRMVTDINSLVNSVYEQKVMLQKAQMKSLEMQINPHFLYNTLDTINWMARAQHADDVGNMAAALGNMMRYSLSKQSFVKLRDEIKILKDFLYIQEFRYGDRMTSFIEVDDELMDYYIPKLIVQPILENAVVHGIEEKLDAGSVMVTAWLESADAGTEDMYIRVEDDGVSMTEENIMQILNEDESIKKKGHTSIGIVNVNKRIQMIYGKNYGLMIQSSLGSGTKMTIHIKASSDNDYKGA